MQIVAQQGKNPETASYLIMTGPNRARVFDGDVNILYPEFNMQSILSRGYWEDYTGSQDIIQALLARATIYNTFEEQLAAQEARAKAVSGRA